MVIHGDCMEVMRGMEANSVDAIVTDPPYFKVKADWWDRQWSDPAAFLAWLDTVLIEFQRILRPNGSVYVFASPQMAARVEVLMRERFEVLNRIRWVKQAGWHQKAQKEALRAYLSPHEEIIFAEHFGADNMAKGEAGYAAKCDELRGFVFEPLRAYLDGERVRLGLSSTPFDELLGTNGLCKKYFNPAQWQLPTEVTYEVFQAAFPGFFLRPFSDLRAQYEELRAQYEELRAQYEELRRPFSVSADVPFTDVWDFPTVQAYAGKHPCEKPQALLEHIIRSSSRPGAVVFDAFTGSGATGEAAVRLGRQFIGAEIDESWANRARARIDAAQPSLLQAAD